jgi:large subunit ribosomal protein L10
VNADPTNGVSIRERSATLAHCGVAFCWHTRARATGACSTILTERRKKHLAITRERKEELVATYTELLGRTDGFIVAEYKGLTVAQAKALRRKLAEAGGTFSVTKNTLFRIALEQNGWVIPDELLAGQTGVVFGNGNLPAVAKVVQTYAKDTPDQFKVTGGVLSNSVFRASDLEAIANLPTVEEIRAQLIGVIVAPASQLAGLLEAATSQVVNVLQAYVDDQSPASEAA